MIKSSCSLQEDPRCAVGYILFGSISGTVDLLPALWCPSPCSQLFPQLGTALRLQISASQARRGWEILRSVQTTFWELRFVALGGKLLAKIGGAESKHVLACKTHGHYIIIFNSIHFNTSIINSFYCNSEMQRAYLPWPLLLPLQPIDDVPPAQQEVRMQICPRDWYLMRNGQVSMMKVTSWFTSQGSLSPPTRPTPTNHGWVLYKKGRKKYIKSTSPTLPKGVAFKKLLFTCWVRGRQGI